MVFVAALLVRVAFAMWSWSGFYAFPQSGMSRLYFKEGYAIAAGYGYVTGFTKKGHDVLGKLYGRVNAEGIRATPEIAQPLAAEDVRIEMVHPPGMSLLVAGINRVFGIPADVPIQVISILLDSIAAVLIWWVAATFLSARMGVAAGLVYAFFPPLAHAAAASRMPVGMCSFFVIACLVCVLQATRCRAGKALAWYAAAGLVLGLGSYLRPDYLLMPVFMFLGLWAFTRRFFRSAGAMILTQVLAIVTLLPWAYRNHSICGRWVLTSTSVGATLIVGLGEYDNPWGFGGSDVDRAREVKAQGIAHPWSSEGDVYFRGLFWKSVKQKPLAYVMTIVRRVPLVLATPFTFGYENPWKTQHFSEAREAGDDRYQVVKRRPLYVLAAYWDRLAMGGLVLTSILASAFMLIKERRSFGLLLLLFSPHLYSIASHIVTHLEPRFLMPSIFSALIGLAYVLSRGWRDRFATCCES